MRGIVFGGLHSGQPVAPLPLHKVTQYYFASDEPGSKSTLDIHANFQNIQVTQWFGS